MSVQYVNGNDVYMRKGGHWQARWREHIRLQTDDRWHVLREHANGLIEEYWESLDGRTRYYPTPTDT